MYNHNVLLTTTVIPAPAAIALEIADPVFMLAMWSFDMMFTTTSVYRKKDLQAFQN